jgi:hypothetical protein
MSTFNAILVKATTAVSGVQVLTGLPSPQNVSTTLLCTGVFDATFQVFGTIGTTSNINVEYTVDPGYKADVTAGLANVFVKVGVLTAAAPYLYQAGHIHALRLNATTVNAGDNWGIAWVFSDKR